MGGEVNLLERIQRHFEWRRDIEKQEVLWHIEFGHLMRAQRVASGLSLRHVAMVLNESHSAVSDYENGNRRWNEVFAKDYLRALADKRFAYGVPQTT